MVLTDCPCLHRTARRYSSLTVTFDVTSSNIVYLEHVVVTMTISVRGYTTTYSISSLFDILEYFTSEQELYDWLQRPHPRRGDIKVDLTAPSGTVSHLLPYRRYDFINDEGYSSWPFMSVHHWGENPIGRWTLTVSFKSSSGYASVSGVSMKLYGVSVPNPGTTVTTHPTHSTPSTPSTLSTHSTHPSPHTHSNPHTHSSTLPQSTPSHPSLPDTVKYVLIGVFSVGGLVLMIGVGVLVGVVLYCARRSKVVAGVRFRRLRTEIVDDMEKSSSVRI